MKGFVTKIEEASLGNEYFRKVLYTSKYSQLVVMSLKPKEDIGEEVHTLDQFIRCEQGSGKVIIDGVEHVMNEGVAILVPAGAKHNIQNVSSDKSMKLSMLYAPPNHCDGVIHKTKIDAEEDTEQFDGRTTE